MIHGDRAVARAVCGSTAQTALREAADALWKANRLEAEGQRREAAQAIGEASQVLATASAHEALRGVCRRVWWLGPADPRLDEELSSVAEALDAGIEAEALAVRAFGGDRKEAAVADPPARLRKLEENDIDAALLIWEGRHLRRSGRLDEAVRLFCVAQRRGAAAIVHREWAYALAAAGDIEGALAHMSRWCEARPENRSAILWRAQLLWRSDRWEEALAARSLLRPPGDGPDFSVFADGLLGDEIALAWGAAGPPFWWVNSAASGSEETWKAGNGTIPPLVVLDRDDMFFRVPLRRILAHAGFDVRIAHESEGLEDAAGGRAPAAFMVHFEEPVGRGLAVLQALRARPEFLSVPVVAITTLSRRGIDLGALRELGVVGVVDKRMIPEDVADRMQRLVKAPIEGRRFVRVPAFFPVDLEAEGVTTTEYARNLSVGGIGLLSARAIDVNTDVTLRFHVEVAGVDAEIRGRVVYVRKDVLGADRDLGIFFYPMDDAVRSAIEKEVHRRVRAAETDGGRS